MSQPLPVRRRLNRTNPRSGDLENTNRILEQLHHNQTDQPQIYDETLERDSLEQQNNLGSLIRESSPPISKVVPYPVDIEQTPRFVQTSLTTPTLGLQSPEFTNFRDFDHTARTVRVNPFDQLANMNTPLASTSVTTSTTTVVGTTAVST